MRKKHKVLEEPQPNWEPPPDRREPLMRIRNFLNTLFTTTSSADVAPIANKEVKANVRFGVIRPNCSIRSIDLQPRGEGATDAHDRELNDMMMELENPEDTWN